MAKTTKAIAARKAFTQTELLQLLAINKAISQAKTAVELLETIRQKVMQLIPFHDTGILIVEKNGLHHYDMAVNIKGWDNSKGNLLLQQQKHLNRIEHKGSYVEYILEKMATENGPVIEDWEKVMKQWHHPFFPIVEQLGYNQGLAALLQSGGRVYGGFWLNSRKKNHFTQEQFPLFQAVTDLISVAVANILANEEILEREREKTQLLAISEAIATVQNSKQLIKVIYEKIKPVIDYDNAGLFILTDDGNSVFEMADSEILGDDLQVELESKNLLGPFPMNGLTQDFWFFYKVPTITNFKLQASYVKDPAGSKQFEIALQHGFQELICGPLQCQGKKIGMLCFNSKQQNFYQQKHVNLFKSVSDLIAIAVANILANDELMKREQEKTTLLNISNAISKINDKVALLKSIDELLWPLFHHDDAGFSIVDKKQETFIEYYNLYAKEIPNSEESKYLNSIIYKALYNVDDARLPYASSLVEYYMNRPPEMGLLKDVLPLDRNPELIQLEIEHGLQWYICSPLTVAGNTIGLFNLLFKEANKPTSRMLDLFRQISETMAMAISNILAHEELLAREQEKTKLLSITQAIANIQTKKELIDTIEQTLQPVFGFDEYSIAIADEPLKNYKQLYTDGLKLFSETARERGKKWSPIEDDPHELIYFSANPATMLWDRNNHLEKYAGAWVMKEVAATKLQQNMVTPLIYGNRIIGNLEFMSLHEHFFSTAHFPLYEAVAMQIAAAVKNILANEEIVSLNKQLLAQNQYLVAEVEQQYSFDEMIGLNPKFADVCKNIGLVANTDSTVLILGETGTGKELVARAIHNNSPRKNKPLIKLNCAALPTNLIESELFGHERGAFTGAIDRRIGKFELANGSTLFLDEVGELPLELQAKLLRALQEKEIERLGSNKTLKIDVRIIAATNRELEKEVQAGKFRQDLFYRLHIFPITLPALKERKEDIPLLATHFLERYSKKIGKRIAGFSSKAMQEMMAYNWPGNIRELEHVIERCVIVCNTLLVQHLSLPNIDKRKITVSLNNFIVKTWEEQERDYLLEILKITNGKVKGKGSASEILKLPATTLQSKMDKLGIKRQHLVKSETGDNT